MDAGAHFHNCDFQVHTPRDTNWHGQRAETDDERAAYAQELVDACRLRGVGAIAITDHHDLSFFPYVREAAANERDANGDRHPEPLVVFPGMELTLAVPCQAILVLDADFPDDQLSTVGAALAMTPVPIDQPLGPVAPLAIHTFSDLHKKLDEYSWLQGRYIVFPNVSEGGNHTLLRSGMGEKYREMPCVAGYLDGLITQHGTGNQKIVAGKDENYGSKRVGCFQTSDNRRRDHSDLGTATTWVKWATPTAEALRQAALAQETRLSHTAPVLPITYISRLSVSNSLFLGPLVLELNQQYNALIGGRGTGKSTMLEYLRWALCDVPEDVASESSSRPIQARENIIDATLRVIPNAEVEVHFVVNDLPHIVRRAAEGGEITLKVGDTEFRRVSEADVRSIIPIQAFSQKQLSAVSGRVDELDRFVTSPIQTQLNDLEREQEAVASEIRATYGRLRRFRTLEAAIRQDELGESSLRAQAERLREGLTGIPFEDQQLLGQRSAHEAVRQLVAKLERAVARAEDATTEYEKSLSDLLGVVSEPMSDVPAEAQSALDMRTALAGILEQAIEGARTAQQRLTEATATGSEYSEGRERWKALSAGLDARYEAATARWTAHEQRISDLSDVENRQRALADALAVAREQLTDLGNPQRDYEGLRSRWVALRGDRLGVMSEQCEDLTELSGEEIRAEINPISVRPELAQALKRVVSGSNVRGSRIDDLMQALFEQPEPFVRFEDVLEELEQLGAFDPSDALASIPVSPTLVGLGLPQADVERIASVLEPEAWLEFSLIPLNPKPDFLYRSKENRFIAFRNASAGQQATALLHVLLSQHGPPLIIDQPEDDLDNEGIPEVVEQIWQAKSRRQLIFTSHDANLVVNGDADLVVCCSNRVAGDHSAGQIAHQGAIDVPHVREAITRVMEGGEDAFKLRTAKYGF